MERRGFVTGCAALAGLAAAGGAGPWLGARAGEAQVLSGPRARLVGEARQPLAASRLARERSYLFLYPFESTPCFLLDVGKPVPGRAVPLGPEGGTYAWPGGVGAGRSIVAFSAICPHAYTHPTRETAMIHYYGSGETATVAQRASVISCCAHGSTFDPVRGAAPLQPPAEIPLAAVLLEWEEPTDTLYALGVLGRPVFEEFFKSFPQKARRPAEATVPVWELDRYSRAVLPC